MRLCNVIQFTSFYIYSLLLYMCVLLQRHTLTINTYVCFKWWCWFVTEALYVWFNVCVAVFYLFNSKLNKSNKTKKRSCKKVEKSTKARRSFHDDYATDKIKQIHLYLFKAPKIGVFLRIFEALFSTDLILSKFDGD